MTAHSVSQNTIYTLYRCPLWLLLGITLGYISPLTAGTIAIPQWAKSFEHSLPSVSPEIISEVDDLFQIIAKHAPDYGEAADREYSVAIQRRLALGEQADQAMIWQYFKEPELPPASGPPTDLERQTAGYLAEMHGQKRMKLLEMLRQDPTLEKWLLPLLKLRLDELQRSTAQLPGIETIATSELIGIEVYCVARGDTEGVKRVRDIRDELIAKGRSPRAFAKRSTDEEIGAEIEESKDMRRMHDMPHWKNFARGLAGRGYIDAATAKRIADTPVSNLGASKATPPAEAKPQTESQSVTPTTTSHKVNWVVWSAVIFSALGLLWLMLKKRK